MVSFQMHNLVFQHFIEMPSLNGIFCSAKERLSGKTRLFLAFKNNKRIYMRDALKGTWEEVKDSQGNNLVQDTWNKIIKERKVPAFRYEGGGVND